MPVGHFLYNAIRHKFQNLYLCIFFGGRNEYVFLRKYISTDFGIEYILKAVPTLIFRHWERVIY